MNAENSAANFNFLLRAAERALAFPEEAAFPERIAEGAGLSLARFAAACNALAGTEPDTFLERLRPAYRKRLPASEQTRLPFADSRETPERSNFKPPRLPVELSEMPERQRNSASLRVGWAVSETWLGLMLAAETETGVCWAAFAEDEKTALDALRAAYPNAVLFRAEDGTARAALRALNANEIHGTANVLVRLHLPGTAFQHKVWRLALEIPPGRPTTYGALAAKLGDPKAARAVGSAVGANPAAYFVPCHRVLPAGGEIGGYRWGRARKAVLIALEAGIASE